MYPEVAEFIERFEAQAREAGQYRHRLGKYEIAFLEQVWGPAFHYNFEGLHPEYPFKDFKGGERFADFVYTKGGIRLMIEIDGYTTHARDISIGVFNDHLARQNDLVLQGWMVLRFSTYQVEKQPMVCQGQILQAIGHWWSQMIGLSKETDIWTHRKRLLSQMAMAGGGLLRIVDISRHFSIPVRTARDWAERFVREGVLIPEQPNKKVVGYRLK